MIDSVVSEIEIHDNFCQRFEQIAQESKDAFYRDYKIVSATYRGICVRAGRSALEKEFLGRFLVKFEYFRRYEKGMLQDTFIHSDMALSDYTAILSLKDDNGALCFWRHKETGMISTNPQDSDSIKKLFEDGMYEDRWEIYESVPMIKNRCVIYPANLFHSRYPKDWEGEDPRLVLVLFMNKSNNS